MPWKGKQRRNEEIGAQPRHDLSIAGASTRLGRQQARIAGRGKDVLEVLEDRQRLDQPGVAVLERGGLARRAGLGVLARKMLARVGLEGPGLEGEPLLVQRGPHAERPGAAAQVGPEDELPALVRGRARNLTALQRLAHEPVHHVGEAELLVGADGAGVVGVHVQAQLGRAIEPRGHLDLADQHLQEPAPARLGGEEHERDPPVVPVLPLAPLGGDADGAEQLLLPIREHPVARERWILDRGRHGLGDGGTIERAIFRLARFRQHEVHHPGDVVRQGPAHVMI